MSAWLAMVSASKLCGQMKRHVARLVVVSVIEHSHYTVVRGAASSKGPSAVELLTNMYRYYNYKVFISCASVVTIMSTWR